MFEVKSGGYYHDLAEYWDWLEDADIPKNENKEVLFLVQHDGLLVRQFVVNGLAVTAVEIRNEHNGGLVQILAMPI